MHWRHPSRHDSHLFFDLARSRISQTPDYSTANLIPQQIRNISFIAIMVGSKSSSYLAKKLRDAQLLLSSKAKQTLHGVLTRTPRLIKTSFTASSSGKKKDQPTNVDPSPRPSTRLAGVAVGASSAASSSSNAGGATPFTPAPTRGRKKKSTIVRPDAHVVPHSLLPDDGDVFDDPYEVPDHRGGTKRHRMILDRAVYWPKTYSTSTKVTRSPSSFPSIEGGIQPWSS